MAVIPLGNPATPVSPIDSIEDLLRRARAGTWEVDLADGTLHASDAFHALLGFAPAAGRNVLRRWLDRTHPEDAAAAVQALEAQRQQAAGEFEFGLRMQHADGSWRWLLLRGRPAGLSANGFRRLSGAAFDLTEPQTNYTPEKP